MDQLQSWYACKIAGILSTTAACALSGITDGILSGIYSDMLSGDLLGKCSGSLAGVHSDILSVC